MLFFAHSTLQIPNWSVLAVRSSFWEIKTGYFLKKTKSKNKIIISVSRDHFCQGNNVYKLFIYYLTLCPTLKLLASNLVELLEFTYLHQKKIYAKNKNQRWEAISFQKLGGERVKLLQKWPKPLFPSVHLINRCEITFTGHEHNNNNNNNKFICALQMYKIDFNLSYSYKIKVIMKGTGSLK